MLQLKPEGLDLADAISQPIAICGRPLIADNSGALYWPGQGALVVADLHLGSGGSGGSEASGANGVGGSRQTLVRLAEVIDRYEPAKVIVLWSGVPADTAAAGLAEEDLQILRILQEDCAWTWITGHGDRPIAPQLGGSACAELRMAGIALRARPTPGWATHEIAAFMRPAARLSMYGYALRRACFVGNRQRLVMPAFGSFAGDGLNVLDQAFRPMFGTGGMAVWMLGQEGLYPVATRLLAED